MGQKETERQTGLLLTPTDTLFSSLQTFVKTYVSFSFCSGLFLPLCSSIFRGSCASPPALPQWNAQLSNPPISPLMRSALPAVLSQTQRLPTERTQPGMLTRTTPWQTHTTAARCSCTMQTKTPEACPMKQVQRTNFVLPINSIRQRQGKEIRKEILRTHTMWILNT